MILSTAEAFLGEAEKHSLELSNIKRRVSIPDYGWYPYSTLGTLPLLVDLMRQSFGEIWAATAEMGVADIGCGDGDLSFVFSRMGCQVDAFDRAETNFNQMRGVRALAAIANNIVVHEADLDTAFRLPKTYGLAVFLGTLYHLKNLIWALETIAAHASWCVLSTRIAQMTPDRRTRIDDQPLAYLLNPREANNDPSNFWIFSPVGLERLVSRAGWAIMASQRVGCKTDSDPVSSVGDERMFLLLRSIVLHPDLHIRPLDGWHQIEGGQFRWTAKTFSLFISPPPNAKEFALRLFLPESVIANGLVIVRCFIENEPAGVLTYASTGITEFRGRLPDGNAPYVLQFRVESDYTSASDERDLGVCVPLANRTDSNPQQIPLRIS